MSSVSLHSQAATTVHSLPDGHHCCFYSSLSPSSPPSLMVMSVASTPDCHHRPFPPRCHEHPFLAGCPRRPRPRRLFSVFLLLQLSLGWPQSHIGINSPVPRRLSSWSLLSQMSPPSLPYQIVITVPCSPDAISLLFPDIFGVLQLISPSLHELSAGRNKHLQSAWISSVADMG